MERTQRQASRSPRIENRPNEPNGNRSQARASKNRPNEPNSQPKPTRGSEIDETNPTPSRRRPAHRKSTERTQRQSGKERANAPMPRKTRIAGLAVLDGHP